MKRLLPRLRLGTRVVSTTVASVTIPLVGLGLGQVSESDRRPASKPAHSDTMPGAVTRAKTVRSTSRLPENVSGNVQETADFSVSTLSKSTIGHVERIVRELEEDRFRQVTSAANESTRRYEQTVAKAMRHAESFTQLTQDHGATARPLGPELYGYPMEIRDDDLSGLGDWPFTQRVMDPPLMPSPKW